MAGALFLPDPRGGRVLLLDPVLSDWFSDVTELAWFEQVAIAGIAVEALPARHEARRSLFDRDRCFASFAIVMGTHRVFFAGDTAYFPFFSALKTLRPRFDVALVPIGAYTPTDLVHDVHMTPEEASAAAEAMGAPMAVGMHWGTFRLSPEPIYAPPRRFLATGSATLRTVVLRIGGTMRLP